MTTPNGTFITLGAVITTTITPRGIRKQRCRRGPLVAGDGRRWLGGMSVSVGESTARCKRLRELMQGGLC